MWPGSDLPVGPPPPQPAPPPVPPPVRPGSGWLLLPGVLLAIAAILLTAVVAVNLDEMSAADGPVATGDVRTGLRVELAGGHDYFFLVRTGGTSPTDCTLTYTGQDAVPVTLTRDDSWLITPPSGYRYFASFAAPVSGTAEMTCRGTSGQVQIMPDDSSFSDIAVAFIVAVALGGIAIVALIVIAVMRMGSVRRRREAMSARLAGYRGY